MIKTGQINDFKDLLAWQKTYQLCLGTYKLVKNFPKHEDYGLKNQMTRSASSVPSNIAEGHCRHNLKEYIQFLYIAYSSLAELETQMLLAKDLDYISNNDHINFYELQKECQRILFGLIKSLKNKLYNP